MESPGRILATFILKTLGRSCSRREAVCPCSRASSYSRRACSRSRISAVISRSPVCITMPYTAARVEAGNRYTASSGRVPSLRYTCSMVTSAMTPAMWTWAATDLSGSWSTDGSSVSTKKKGARVLSSASEARWAGAAMAASDKTNAIKLERTFIVSPLWNEQCSRGRRLKGRLAGSPGFEAIDAPFLEIHFQPRVGRVAAELVELGAHLGGHLLQAGVVNPIDAFGGIGLQIV